VQVLVSTGVAGCYNGQHVGGHREGLGCHGALSL
jgi:hypothetical protein